MNRPKPAAHSLSSLNMFKKLPNLIWAISKRQFGDCRKSPDRFLETLGLKKNNLVLAQQVHGNKIRVVGDKDKGQTIDGADGLVTGKPGLILGIRTADCLPILFYEPMAKIIGACHAGWRGVLAKLPQKMIDLLMIKGALPENILVAIGPHICGNCYEIKPDRADLFKNQYNQLAGMLTNKNGKIYLDLVRPTMIQLIHSGLLKKNIKVSAECTSCDNGKYYSYRKDKNKNYGEMLSVISLIK